jgi:hypothetical protein
MAFIYTPTTLARIQTEARTLQKEICSMRRFLRITNGIFWLAAWVALTVHFNDVSNPLRMLGEAVIPAILWLGIDFLLTFFLRPSKNSN